MNFDELLAAYSCKAVSVLFKFAHLFLLLYLLCYPYWQFFMSFPMFWAVYFIVYSVWWWFPLFEFWLIKWHSSFNYSFVIRYFNLFFSISLQNSDQSGFLGNCPPTLSLSHTTYLSLRAKCWLRGWAVSQKPKLISKFHSYQTKEYHGDLHICWCCPRCAAVGCCYFHLVLPEKTKKGGLWVCKVLRAYRLKRELITRSEQLPCACATAFSRTSLFLERFWRAFWISFKFHKTSQQNLQT